MNDEHLDKLIDAAAAHVRVPPEPALDAIWARIDAERHPATTARQAPRGASWWRTAGIAAAIALSFTLGRLSTYGAESDVTLAPAPVPSVAAGEQPVANAAYELLGQTVVLLSALPAAQAQVVSDRDFARQAGDLLMTTRLLIDSRVAERDPALKSLLEDLELVLAQLARIRNGESRAELDLITDALQQQDIVPRIRSVAAGLSAGAD